MKKILISEREICAYCDNGKYKRMYKQEFIYSYYKIEDCKMCDGKGYYFVNKIVKVDEDRRRKL